MFNSFVSFSLHCHMIWNSKEKISFRIAGFEPGVINRVAFFVGI